MTKPIISIRQATLEDREKVTQFRIDQFRSAKEFTVANTDVFSVMKGKVLIAELNKEIISTMQFQTLTNKDELIHSSTEYIPDSFNSFSTLYLSKGGTTREFRKTGINSCLRQIILQLAFDDLSINSLTGVAYENAPRMNILKTIGYTTTETYTINKTYLMPTENPLFLSLSRQNFLTAISLLETEITELKNYYSIANTLLC
jgi:hypothetical protein